MQVEERNGAAERTTLIACITSTAFLTRVADKLPKEPCHSRWSNLILGWCVRHFNKYRAAPGKIIESLFQTWSAAGTDKDTAKLVEKFLLSLSGEYARYSTEIDVEYTIDLSENFFNEVQLVKLQEEVALRIERGEVQAALLAQQMFKRVDLRSPPYVDVLRDKDVQKESLTAKQRTLVKYPGAAGEFFGSEFGEDSFVGVMASAKGGKSYTLLDVGWRAMRQNRRVAYFQVGDLSKNQIMRRFHARAAYRPLEPELMFLPTSIELPIGGGRQLAVVSREDRDFDKPLSWELGQKAFAQAASKSKGGLRLSYHPIRTISVAGVKSILDRWDQDGWRANVVIVDYAYNLLPVNNKDNPIDQTSYTWAMLRQLSEMRRACVVTANQTNKEGYKAWVLTRSHFADSKMILAHVTAMIGVNMTDEEKSKQIVRYNWIVRREGAFSESDCLYCASCLSIASPIVVSTLPNK
jgi:hypothetical protein